jgi:hypothetical protein
MSAVLEEKNVNETQPTLSQRVGYVLVQMGDELEPLVLDYKSHHPHEMDEMGIKLVAEMDEQTITQLAAQAGKDEQTVKQDIGIAIQVIGWLHFPDLVTKPEPKLPGMKPETIEAFKKLIGCMNTGIDGLEYQRKIREEAW